MSSVAAARITCVSTLVAGVQSSAGHPSGPQSPQTPGMAIDTSLPRVPDTSRPDSGRSGSSGRSIRRSFRLVATSSTLLKAADLGRSRMLACGQVVTRGEASPITSTDSHRYRV
jgi:hypothetical protein